MSTFFTNTKNFAYDRAKNWLNCVQNFSSQIVHSKPVQSNAEKVSFVTGYTLMSLNQYLFGKDQLSLPMKVQKNIVEGLHENLDWLVGLGSSEKTEMFTALFLNILEPIQRRVFNDNPSVQNELVSKYSFPPQILEDRFTDFRNFVLASKIYLPITYFEHPVTYSDQHQDILVNVNGHLVPSKTILENFQLENRAISERMFLPAFIVDKTTGDKYSYLERGLTRHDVEKDIGPYKILPVHERPGQPIIKFNFCIDSKLESPEDAANFFYHAWCELVQPTGECYSFGLFGKGVTQCPDPSSFRKADVRSISFEITPDQALSVFEKVQLLRDEMKWSYHFTKNNCATLVKKIASVIDIDISERGKIKIIDNPITRIKMYAVSSILAQVLRDPNIVSKIGVVQELANIKEFCDELPVTIKEVIKKFSFEDSLESAMNLLENYSSIKTALLTVSEMFQTMIEKVDADKISGYLNKMTNLIPPNEIKELCRSILTGSTKELTYKIYNLFDTIFTNYYDYEVDSPGVVYEHLRKIQAQKNKQKYEFIAFENANLSII